MIFNRTALIYGIYYAVDNSYSKVAFWYGALTIPFTACIIVFYNDNYTK